jgi:uncharacterized protein involved in exopolysaccharide biosynthesis
MSSTNNLEQASKCPSIDFLDYLEVVAKHWKLIVKITIGTFILSIIVSLQLTKVYSSTTRVLPPQQDSGMISMMIGAMGSGMANIASDLLGKSTTADLYVGILKCETVKDAIIDKFKLKELYNEKYRLDIYKVLDKVVDISTGKKDGIISITVQDKDPKLATEIANAYVEQLSNVIIKLNSTGATQNRKFLEERISKTKSDLSQAEENLKSFQSKNKALDLTEQTKGTIKIAAELIAQLANEEIKLLSLQRALTDSSQEVKNQKLVVFNLKKQQNTLEGNLKGGAIPSIGSIPDLGQEYVRLTREFKIQENLLELFTKQYEMAKLTELNDVPTIQVIQKAIIPDKKIKPKRAVIVMLSTFTAFIFIILYVFAIESLDKLSQKDIDSLKRIKALFK